VTRDARPPGETSGRPRRRLRFVTPPSLGQGKSGRAAARMERFLSRWLAPGFDVEVSVAETYAELARALSSGQAEIGWTPPLVGARVAASGGRSLVRVVRGGASTFRAAIVCQKGRPVDPSNLFGMRAVWVDRESTAGYLLPRAWVRSLGFDPDKVFASERFAGSHRAAIEELLGDRADLTAVFAAAADSERPHSAMAELSPAEQARLSIVAYTEEAPNDTIMVAPGVDEETYRYLQRRLLSAVDDAEGSRMLHEVYDAESLTAVPEDAGRAMQDIVLATFGLVASPNACGGCGGRVSPSARFCERCGVPVRRSTWVTSSESEAAAVEPPPPSVVPVSGRWASAPPATGAAAEGVWFEERKLATVLFGDLSNFTEISSQLEPDAVRELANECFEPVSAEVERRGGRIVKYIGDGVMAVFGVPLSSEDDPKRAVRAALSMVSRLDEASDRIAARYGVRVGMRIGINTGWMMVGTVGGRGHTSLDVMGWTVNVASRIEGMARTGEILTGHATYRLVEGDFEVEPLGPVRLKGVPEPIPLFKVIAERIEDARASERGLRTEVFLRDRELAVLEDAFDAAATRGRARVVKLIADAGLGKSRLVEQLALEIGADARRPEILRAAGVLGATATVTPLHLLERLIRQRFGVRADQPVMEARERVVTGIAGAWGPLERDAGEKEAALLADLGALGAPYGADVPISARDHSGSQDTVFAAFAAWIRRLARERPVCMILSDLQWADDRSLDFIERLPAALGDAPVLLVVTARPELDERKPGWLEPHDDSSARVDLRPLTAEQMTRFIAPLLGEASAIPERLQAELCTRAEGNPEFARELVRLLVDRGALVLGEDGRPAGWRPDRLGAITLPETVQGALQARLDGLPRPERELLRRAAVVGRMFWRGAVEWLSDGGAPFPAEVGTLLESLEAKGLVRESDSPVLEGEQEFSFHTQALREITYQSIPRQAREAAHRRVAAWLRDRGELWQGAHAELAGHLDAGGAAAEARRAYIRAARHAASIFANEEAVGFYERALALGASPAGAPAESSALRRELAVARARVGRFDEALEALDAAAHDLEAAGTPPDDEVFGWLELERSRVLKDCGRNDALVAAVDRGLAVVEARAPSVLQVLLYATRAFARFERNDPAGARADCEAGLVAGEAIATRDPSWQQAMARLNNTLGGIRLYYLGDLDGAEDCYKRALALRRDAGDQQGELDALVNLGAIAFERRDYPKAASHFEEGLGLARKAHWVKYIAVCASNLGQALLAAGSAAQAVLVLEDAERLAHSAGLLEVHADSTRALAEARLRSGSPQEAYADALKSIDYALQAGIPRFEAAAHAVAMECLLAGARREGGTGAPLEHARTHLDAAIRILRASGHSTALAEIAELESKLERAARGWTPTVVVDRPVPPAPPSRGKRRG